MGPPLLPSPGLVVGDPQEVVGRHFIMIAQLIQPVQIGPGFSVFHVTDLRPGDTQDLRHSLLGQMILFPQGQQPRAELFSVKHYIFPLTTQIKFTIIYVDKIYVT